MISGPIIPRTRESLWDLVSQDPSVIERGLQIVRGDVVLDEGLVIDALARDASGAPVLMFSVTESSGSRGVSGERRLPSRIRDACSWVTSNWRVLASALPQCTVRWNDRPRLMVLGFEISEVCLERLRDPVFAELSVYRFEGAVIEGQRHIGVTPIFGRAIDEMGADDIPAGIRDAGIQNTDALARTGQFLEIMRRLDPDLRREGDRYSRRFYSSAGLLAELSYEDDTLSIAVASDAPQIIHSEEDVDEVVDHIMRCYLAGRLQPSPKPVAAAAPLDLRPNDTSPTRLTLGGLRERMAQAQVSDEEFEAICELDTRGGEE